ncbi:MAG: hypothetical protein WBD36_13670 [Bacteroidota bacterium]
MKTKYLLATALTVALTLPLFGQHTRADMKTTDMKKHDMTSMMGKPTIDATVEGLHMKVWLMTQKQHKKMMKGKKMGEMMMGNDRKGMKHEGMGMNKDTSMGMGKEMKGMKHDDMGMDKAMMDSMMAGTHCIMLDVSDVATRKGISGASTNVMIMSPSMKHSSVDLKPMMNHFGSGLTLDEKGKYTITASVNVNGVSKSKEFQYEVK